MRGSADHVTCGQAKLLLANLANWILFSICVLVVHSEPFGFHLFTCGCEILKMNYYRASGGSLDKGEGH